MARDIRSEHTANLHMGTAKATPAWVKPAPKRHARGITPGKSYLQKLFAKIGIKV